MGLNIDEIARLTRQATVLQQEAINAKVFECLQILGNKFDKEFKFPTITYGLKGATAGMAWAAENRIDLNVDYLIDAWDDMLNETVPHEVAHIVQRVLWPNSAAHGKEWQYLMRQLGLRPVRCHNYEVVPARKVSRPYVYRCDCRHHNLTQLIHNRIQQENRARRCRMCRGRLVFVRKETNN
jgi:SprT protein